MIDDSKLVFITHPYYAVNNPSNNLKIYTKKKNSNKWTIIQCKTKNEYRKKIKEYALGFYDYARDEAKAHNSIKDYIKEENSSLFDYFMGGKKDTQIMLEKKMKREEMAILKNGHFLLDKDVPIMQKKWSNYIEDSNIQLTVLSFNQNYIDENISIKELQMKISTEVMPKFLSYCGYEKPLENLEWIVSLHSDRDNNYHFHIAWIEKNKCYRNKYNKLGHRMKLTLSDNELNFLKRQTTLTIERKKLYTPALIELEESFENLKKYFNPKDQNFTLKNISDIKFEEKIIKLGFLLNEIRGKDKKYIKYNSLPKNDIGNEIRKLTTEIKRELFKIDSIKKSKDSIYKKIDKINDILLDIDKRNNITNIGFEKAIDNKLIQSKLEKSNNYVLNSIVNHALYNYETKRKRVKKNNFTLEDIINQVAYDNYIIDFEKKKINKVIQLKKKIIGNVYRRKTYKNKYIYALDRLKYEQEKIAEEFYKMFEENKYEK